MSLSTEKEIEKYIKDINEMDPGFKKLITFNSKQLSLIIGVSASTISNWKREGVGCEYSVVGGRTLYTKRKIAEWLVLSNVKTA